MENTTSGIVYECVRCGAKVPSEELEMRGGGIRHGEDFDLTDGGSGRGVVLQSSEP